MYIKQEVAQSESPGFVVAFSLTLWDRRPHFTKTAAPILLCPTARRSRETAEHDLSNGASR